MKPEVFGNDDLQLHSHWENCQGQPFFKVWQPFLLAYAPDPFHG